MVAKLLIVGACTYPREFTTLATDGAQCKSNVFNYSRQESEWMNYEYRKIAIELIYINLKMVTVNIN